jgi:hypothetical protein
MNAQTPAVVIEHAVHPDFPGYDVWADGTVVSRIHRRARVLKPIAVGKYAGFTLRDRLGAIRRIYHHRLVCEAFHGPCPDGQETRHRDGDRLNNSATNLEWGTRSENMRDKERHGTAPKGERHGCAKLTETDVREMRRLRAAGASLPDLMARFGVTRMTCWRAVSGRQWTHI